MECTESALAHSAGWFDLNGGACVGIQRSSVSMMNAQKNPAGLKTTMRFLVG
jgi:hypothetical protein